MATISLDNTYRIKTDQFNYNLEKYSEVINKKQKKKSHKWIVRGHHSTLEHALHKYIQEVIRDEDTTDVYKLIRKLDDLKDHITEVLNNEVIVK